MDNERILVLLVACHYSLGEVNFPINGWNSFGKRFLYCLSSTKFGKEKQEEKLYCSLA